MSGCKTNIANTDTARLAWQSISDGIDLKDLQIPFSSNSVSVYFIPKLRVVINNLRIAIIQ